MSLAYLSSAGLKLRGGRCSSFAADTACSTCCICSPTYDVMMYAQSRAVEEASEEVMLPSVPAVLTQVNDGQKYQVEYTCSCCGLFGGSGDCCQPVDSCSYFTSSCGNTKPVADAYYVRLFLQLLSETKPGCLSWTSFPTL